MFEQAEILGLETVFDDVLKYELTGEIKKVYTSQNV